jgi:hypothetical protein
MSGPTSPPEWAALETTMVTVLILTLCALFIGALYATFRAQTWSGFLINRSECFLYDWLEPRDDKTDPLFCLRMTDDDYRLLLQTSFSLKPYVGQRVCVTGHRRWGVLVVEKVQVVSDGARSAARPCTLTQHVPGLGHRL